VRGPASLLYGNNALGGVVNVISNDIPKSIPASLEGYVAAQAESVNPGGGFSGSVTMPLTQTLAFAVRGSGRAINDMRTGGDGELANTDFRGLNGTVGFGYIRSHASAGAAYRINDFSYGLASERNDPEAGIRIQGVRHEVTGRGDLLLEHAAITQAELDVTAQWYRHDEIEPGGAVGTTFELKTQTANLTARTRAGNLQGAAGIAGLFKQYMPKGEEALTPAANSSNASAFIFQELPLRNGDTERSPHLEAGARYDFYYIRTREGGDRFGPRRTRTFQNISGSIGLNVPFNENVAASISFARAFRAPTVEELFSNAFHAALGSFDVGNPDLEPETNHGIDAVLRAESRAVVAQVSAYYNRINNYIAPNITGDTAIVDEDGETMSMPLNIFRQEDAVLRGIEVEIEASITSRLVVDAMAEAIRATFVGGEPLPFMPAAELGAGLRWDNGRFFLGGDVRHTFAQDRVPVNELAVGDYTLVDLSTGLTLSRAGRTHLITLRADNIFDVLYREATSRIKDFAASPGRNLTLVYRVIF